jgi:antitoxin component of RelBE/YafQ-DinJ toxin-antitoxin module
MKISVEVDDEVYARARRCAEALGTTVEELVRLCLVRVVDGNSNAEEFERLSKLANGDSRGWKFNREEVHERI